jgi:hypothetical protein
MWRCGSALEAATHQGTQGAAATHPRPKTHPLNNQTQLKIADTPAKGKTLLFPCYCRGWPPNLGLCKIRGVVGL